MELDIYQVDAFAEEVFSGNPAAVIPLFEWLSDGLMQRIAQECGQSETAFFVRRGEYFELRWFTPDYEIDLCGHATLASAHVLYEFLDYTDPVVVFETKSGRLFVDRENGLYSMDFPAWSVRPIQVTERVAQALGARPDELFMGERDMMAVFGSEEQVRALKPDFRLVSKLDGLCMICTAPGLDHDFVSRTFVAITGLPEDPVTGSAHCTLVPFWAERLGKSALRARQVSARGGVLICENLGSRVKIAGHAVTFMKGTITL
ncbi:MAG: PhzF family phenazine biosynthesis protein [Pseudodesulfovibrio sp.]|uniref:Phenazine biosynthesis protein PhzF family n=1 Tax=Pseudodesulfovibrio aespoeensis (strain ATCC 700646 / DSM 10631 / Aspo-2) TaxID=643562 RepID=E6VU30_PSEA9|nr:MULTISPECIES: PhzF family phenazine biosynthesis protein [Pseudodesulfovibrio]MBU4192583.1 PhzF family phenazine biosynthesis protein [Pseudomonadota bacterium]ADU62223.1 phenazine biosynthesis protein PhzF family [Pseudodesulfovibrio aespoeensis Aspo-2]MBU4243068.1 PhzF family phenazine biosynthesis protein [Pseudomonadota bacterium]MBU4378904.1 PhzF family phenazine biosynthesis protein [Pseudomonadota bacterium]MBU4476087.1 PhzF family phenazine biosynthesis protein [Pseudomonadota bacte